MSPSSFVSLSLSLVLTQRRFHLPSTVSFLEFLPATYFDVPFGTFLSPSVQTLMALPSCLSSSSLSSHPTQPFTVFFLTLLSFAKPHTASPRLLPSFPPQPLHSRSGKEEGWVEDHLTFTDSRNTIPPRSFLPLGKSRRYSESSSFKVPFSLFSCH